MSFRNDVGMLTVSLLLAGGCEPGGPKDLDDADKAIKVCDMTGSCASPNCDDINQPDQGAGSDFSMLIPKSPYSYKLTGFYQDANKSWLVRGWLVNQNTKEHKSNDGKVKSVIIQNVSYALVDLTAEQTRYELTYCANTNQSTTSCTKAKILSGKYLDGVQLLINIPVTDGGAPRLPYKLTFNGSPQVLDITQPNSPEVFGVSLTYETTDISPTSLCAGPGGVAQRTLFYQGAQWNPNTFVKYANSGAVTVTCELGAIAACMSWGYKPWDKTTFHGESQSMDSWHAICVNAKTANYCGDGTAWTHYGTKITVKDPLAPPVMSEVVNYPEAYWTTTGAACVNTVNRRIPSLNWNSCLSGGNTTAMPDCATFDSSNYLITGIPNANP